MNVLIIDNNSTYINQIVNLLGGHTVKCLGLDEFKYDLTVNSYDLIILSGGHPFSVEKYHKRYEQELRLIIRSGVPIIGICLGFELIVYAFGGVLERLEGKIRRVMEIKIESKDKLFNGYKNIKVFESHRWVAKNLPDVITALASSEYGIEAVKHSTREIYGFQFHPEIVVDKKDLAFFRNLINKFSK
jgi:GMP synthase (glutamine-hydrolysing)